MLYIHMVLLIYKQSARTHNPKVTGSNPVPATNKNTVLSMSYGLSG
jgi:hypothetical protein